VWKSSKEYKIPPSELLRKCCCFHVQLRSDNFKKCNVIKFLTSEDEIKVISYATATRSIGLRLRANNVRRYVFHNVKKSGGEKTFQ
jgi:hypothetical protein